MKKYVKFMVMGLVALVCSLSLSSFTHMSHSQGYLYGDWAAQVNGQYVKIDFDDDGDFEVKVPATRTEIEGHYSQSQQTLVFHSWSKDYKFSYSLDGFKLVLKPATKADAQLFGSSSTQAVTFKMYDD